MMSVAQLSGILWSTTVSFFSWDGEALGDMGPRQPGSKDPLLHQSDLDLKARPTRHQSEQATFRH